jgi:hypothetical protein
MAEERPAKKQKLQADTYSEGYHRDYCLGQIYFDLFCKQCHLDNPCGLATLHRTANTEHGPEEFKATISLDFGPPYHPKCSDQFSNPTTVYVCRYHPSGVIDLYEEKPQSSRNKLERLDVWLKPPLFAFQQAFYSQMAALQRERILRQDSCLIEVFPAEVMQIISTYFAAK